MAEVAQEYVIEPVTKFGNDSIHLWRKCTKPDSKGTISAARAITARLVAFSDPELTASV